MVLIKKEGAVRSEFKQTTILTNMGCREVSLQFLRVAFILGWYVALQFCSGVLLNL